MFCHQCGAKNTEGSKFCKDCGEAINIAPAHSAAAHHNEKNLISNFVGVMKKYATFTGRASRREYWMFYLAYMIVAISFTILNVIITSGSQSSYSYSYGYGYSYGYEPNPIAMIFSLVEFVFFLAIMIPSLAVGVRRLHDTGHSGGFLFISLVPFIGSIILLVSLASEGDSGNNSYGHEPKKA